jgi:hypothetical protein
MTMLLSSNNKGTLTNGSMIEGATQTFFKIKSSLIEKLPIDLMGIGVLFAARTSNPKEEEEVILVRYLSEGTVWMEDPESRRAKLLGT